VILYFCHPEHCYTLRSWLEFYPPETRGEIRIVGYPDMAAPLQDDTRVCIFSDIDRLIPLRRATAARMWDKLAARGVRLLNHPLSSLRRFDLQQALSNDFRVFRDRLPDDARFPLFLRFEDDHGGARTPLLRDAEAVRRRWKRLRRAIAVEFLDTSDDAGIFRKYSAMRLGDALVPRHLLFSRQWHVKDPDLVGPAQIEEERHYLESFPHRDQIMAVFDRAGIQYGRIDYSLHHGKVQVWEINTNPMLRIPGATPKPERIPNLEMSAGLVNDAFRALA
jgi:hypothetical protein